MVDILIYSSWSQIAESSFHADLWICSVFPFQNTAIAWSCPLRLAPATVGRHGPVETTYHKKMRSSRWYIEVASRWLLRHKDVLYTFCASTYWQVLKPSEAKSSVHFVPTSLRSPWCSLLPSIIYHPTRIFLQPSKSRKEKRYQCIWNSNYSLIHQTFMKSYDIT